MCCTMQVLCHVHLLVLAANAIDFQQNLWRCGCMRRNIVQAALVQRCALLVRCWCTLHGGSACDAGRGLVWVRDLLRGTTMGLGCVHAPVRPHVAGAFVDMSIAYIPVVGRMRL